MNAHSTNRKSFQGRLQRHVVQLHDVELCHQPLPATRSQVGSIEQIKERNIWTVGAVARAQPAPPPWKLDLKGPNALVVGAEGKGLRPLVEKTCDLHTQIPMLGKVASLNVSVATGILLAETVRQRLS